MVLLVTLLFVGGLLSIGAYSYLNPSHDPSKIGFSASLSAATVAQNQVVWVTLSDTNHLPYFNQPPEYGIFWELKFGDWYATNPTCDSHYPFRLGVYQGTYTLANLTGASQLQIFDPSNHFNCPPPPLCCVDYNDYAVWPFGTDTLRVDIGGNWTVVWKESGVWNQPIMQGVLHPLPPGTYTVVAADAWRNVEVLYFRVT